MPQDMPAPLTSGELTWTPWTYDRELAAQLALAIEYRKRLSLARARPAPKPAVRDQVRYSLD